jgi:hypothetical protein
VGEESYCREIETYLCRKNDGHLIRVVGPAFELVSRWAAGGVPLKIAFAGIDRYFERYYRKGPRRRPVRIEFCEADVLDTFDEWRRAVGLVSSTTPEPGQGLGRAVRRQPSIGTHLERAMLKLTRARVNGLLGPEADEVIDRVAQQLDEVRRMGRAVRGDARQALVGRLRQLDAELLRVARAMLDERERVALERDANEQLQPFLDRMSGAAHARAREAAIDRLVRDRLQLPTLELPLDA